MPRRYEVDPQGPFYLGDIDFASVTPFSITSGEVAGSVTPVNYAYLPGEVLREGANGSPGTTDVRASIQAAMDSAYASYAEVYLRNDNAIAAPLLIKSTSQQNLAIVGNGRVSTFLRPKAASISTAPVSVNALIINQSNNGHFHLSKLRCSDAVAYTGQFLYAYEGGGSDGSTQALFSAVIDDCWFGFSSNNSGYFSGGFSNLRVSKCVVESSKTGFFVLAGAGNGDQQYLGNVMNACYDSFIYGATDTQTKDNITVNTLHAYQHLRGPLLEIKNGSNLIFTNITSQPDAANVGSTGIAKLTDCSSVIANNWVLKSGGSVPRASVCLEFVNGASGKFSNIVTDATTGVKFSGTGALDLTFDNCDFTGCDNAVDWNSGTLSGKVIFRNCRFNNSQAYGLLTTTGTHSWDLTLINCEIMNAGLRGTATDRNVDVSTSGKVRLIRCKIGQDNGSAAAAYYIRSNGTGTFEVIDPTIVGTAPTGFNTGTLAITLDGVDSSMPNMPQFVPSLGGSETYSIREGQWSLKNKTLHFKGRISITAIGTGSTTTISGLPFTSHGTYTGVGEVPFFSAAASSVTSLGLTIAAGGTSMILRSLTAAATGTANNAIFQNGTGVIFGGSYPLP
jgi:hypothetical protein